MRWRAEALLFALGVTFAAGSSCDSTVSRSSSSGPNNGGGDDGGGGSEPACVIPPDGICDTTECDCYLCAESAICSEGGCLADNYCDSGVSDSCACSDCDWNAFCVELGTVPCNSDGSCDAASESCGCADCWEAPTCLDNVAACSGDPDGTCDLASETCACVDCFGALSCFPCFDDDECIAPEPCVCADCDGLAECAAACFEDGLCDWYIEGCSCADCAGIEACSGGGGAGP